MSSRFRGKLALVTGGTSGIGEASARRLAEEGATVIAADINAGDGSGEIGDNGGRIIVRACDVADPQQVSDMVEQIVRDHRRIDVLVNNAGISGRERVRLHEVSFDNWDRVMAVNVRGMFAVLRSVLPHMLAQGGGNVVNMASVGSFRATANSAAYLTSKGAVMMLTRAAAVEYARDNIRINAVCPSTTDTAILANSSPEFISQLVSRHPQGRLGKPEEVAALVAFLASDEAPHITGSAYVIDGGRCAT